MGALIFGNPQCGRGLLAASSTVHFQRTFIKQSLHFCSTSFFNPKFLLLNCKKPTAPCVPRRSPIQVLTRPDPAWLPRSDEIGRVQGGMAVSKVCRRRQALYTVNGKRGSGMWCITPQMEGISRGRVCPGSQLRPYRFSAFWLRSSVVSVLISLISDTSPIWGLHIKPIFGPGS